MTSLWGGWGRGGVAVAWKIVRFLESVLDGTLAGMKTPMDQLDDRDGTAVRPGAQLDHYRIEGMEAQARAAITFRRTDFLTNRTLALVLPNPEIEAGPVLPSR